MAYCSNCGEKLPKDAVFCPKCGTRTSGSQAYTTGEEMRQAFEKMSVEMEKAFSLAAKEIQTAFQKARANMQQTTATTTEPMVCGNCNMTNPSGSVYCHNCGKKLNPETKEKKG
jgi:ribosomal protein L40E